MERMRLPRRSGQVCGANSPHESATNTRRSGYLWSIWPQHCGKSSSAVRTSPAAAASAMYLPGGREG
eukprot:532300-Prorocentrum_minimum.AAC.1